MTLIFVYGTLKQGFPNFHLNDGTRVQGDFHTKDKFELYVTGSRYSPCLVRNTDLGGAVVGQVFKVDDLTLAKMDVLERVSEPDGYQKTRITVVETESMTELDVWVYMKRMDQVKSAEVKFGPLVEYEQVHAIQYSQKV